MLQGAFILGIFSPGGTTTCPQRNFPSIKRMVNSVDNIWAIFRKNFMSRMLLHKTQEVFIF